MLRFSEDICCFLGFRLSNSFLKGGSLWRLFMTIDVPIKITRISLNITNQVLTYRWCWLLISALISLLITTFKVPEKSHDH